LQYRIKEAAALSESWEDFKQELRKLKVDVRERGSGVSYSFKDDSDAHRVARGSRLGEAYTREDIERRFALHERLMQAPGLAGAQRFGQEIEYEMKHFTSWKQEMRTAFREAERRAHSPEEFHRLAQERGLTVQKDAEGHYQLQYHDRYGADHTAGPDVLRKGTSDQAVEMRIERTRDNPIQERAQSATPMETIRAAMFAVRSISQDITREVDRNSNPTGGIPDYGPVRERVRRHAPDDDGMRSHQGLDGDGW
jgi:hypothetical protein